MKIDDDKKAESQKATLIIVDGANAGCVEKVTEQKPHIPDTGSSNNPSYSPEPYPDIDKTHILTRKVTKLINMLRNKDIITEDDVSSVNED